MFESHVCMQVCTYMQCNQARLVSIRNCIAPIFWTQCAHSTGSVGQIYTRSSCWSSLSPSEAASIWTFVPCCTWSLFFLQCSFREKTLYHYVYISDPARGVTFRSFFHFLQVKVFVKALIFLLMFFVLLFVFLMSIKTIIYVEEYKNCYSMLWPWHRLCTENCGRNFLGRLFRTSTQPYPRRPWVL